MNRFVLVLLLFFFSSGMAYPAALSNRRLLVYVDDETGRPFLSTIEGAPGKGDEKMNLLFYDEPPASYAVISVNDDLFIFGGERGSFAERPIELGDTISAEWENELIRAVQTIRFVRRKETDEEDGVLFTFSVMNKTAEPAVIGIRQLFDTLLGEHNRFHFTIEGGRNIEFETAFEGEGVPAFWISPDDTDNPTVSLRGVLRGELVTVPSRVVFANYKSLRDNLLDYRIGRRNRFDNLPYSKKDSAVALYYEGGAIAPGEEAVFTTILGLAGDRPYTLEEEEVVVIDKPPSDEPEPVPPVEELSREDADELDDTLARTRGEMEELEELNRILGIVDDALKDDKSLEEEELKSLREKLGLLKK